MEEIKKKKKKEWIDFFREQGNKIISDLKDTETNKEKKTIEINKKIKECKEKQIYKINSQDDETWPIQDKLNEILLLTYASYIVMLECRNRVWEYNNMDFTRRIGELWEPFCKLPFAYPINNLSFRDPPCFDEVQQKIENNTKEYINKIDLDDGIKTELIKQYDIPWSLVNSGAIKLKLDLHFEQDGNHYNCDFKSGFNSNEKGNTNRLLLVGSIYKYLDNNETNILFVRQAEDANNNYLQRLKDSPYWVVYCADDAYDKMKEFTKFDMRSWIDKNIDWENDISKELKEHLQRNDLLKYLTW